MMIFLALLVMSGCIIILLLPMFSELLYPRDATQFSIDQDFVRQPRFFGRALRSALVPSATRHIGGNTPFFGNVCGPGSRLRIAGRVRSAPGPLFDDVLISSRTVSGALHPALPVAYVRGSVWTKADCALGALAVDGSIRLAQRNRVAYWVDVEGHLVAADGCALGRSTSASERLELGAACTFQRLFGRPIATTPQLGFAPTFVGKVDRPHAGHLVAHGSHVRHDIISRTSIQIGSNAVVAGSLKSNGDVEIFSGARIEGNIFAHGSVIVHSGVAIVGTVCSDGNISISEDVEIGRSAASVTVYCGGVASLAAGVTIHGWLVAERGGHVR